jgi:hypothetical protein
MGNPPPWRGENESEGRARTGNTQMVLNSITFLIFAAIVLIAHYRLEHRGQNIPPLLRLVGKTGI